MLEQWRPHLRRAAGVERFQPEIARRLSRQTFTRSAHLVTGDDLVEYFERPVAFLSDVLRQLEPGSRGALVCVYLSGDELAAPVQFTPALAEAVTRLGTSEGDVLRSFSTLDATFLQQSTDTHGDPVWRFRHPTIREGFAAVIAEDANAVTVFIDGLDDDELLQQLDCGGTTARGTLVRVPASKSVEKLDELAFDLLDAGWLDEPVCQLFTNIEREELLGRIRDEILPNLDEEIDRSADGYPSDVEPEHRYQAAIDAITAYKLAFENDSEIVTRLDEAERYAAKAIENSANDYEPPLSSSRLAEPSISRSTTLHDRDEFDDIAESR